MKAMHLDDTIVALATPQGEGAIGIIRLSGKEAIAICDQVFHGQDLRQVASHTIHFGTIREGERILDEVLVSVFKGPKSYTKEDVVEVSCHGSHYILQEVIRLFVRFGARLAKPGEFTMRAFLNGRMDLSQAEAVADLIASGSESAHQVAMQQMRGGFKQEIARLREELIHFAAMIELELDFSEEDVEFADREQLKALVHNIQSVIQHLMDSFALGNVVKTGVATVIAGRPNAGKSTLLNALLQEERAIVSEIPGTTRDTIEEAVNIEGITFRFIDTAGIRDASDKIEAIGVEKTMAKIKQSALLVYLFDVNVVGAEELMGDLGRLIGEATSGDVLPDGDALPGDEGRGARGEGRIGVPVLVVGNKIDLGVEELIRKKYRKLDGWQLLFVSSKHGDHLDELKRALVDAVLAKRVSLEGTIVTNARHLEALSKANQSLVEVLGGLDSGLTGDFLALDIRRALGYLGEITGEVTTDDLLGEIFGKFCIGK